MHRQGRCIKSSAAIASIPSARPIAKSTCAEEALSLLITQELLFADSLEFSQIIIFERIVFELSLC